MTNDKIFSLKDVLAFLDAQFEPGIACRKLKSKATQLAAKAKVKAKAASITILITEDEKLHDTREQANADLIVAGGRIVKNHFGECS